MCLLVELLLAVSKGACIAIFTSLGLKPEFAKLSFFLLLESGNLTAINLSLISDHPELVSDGSIVEGGRGFWHELSEFGEDWHRGKEACSFFCSEKTLFAVIHLICVLDLFALRVLDVLCGGDGWSVLRPQAC